MPPALASRDPSSSPPTLARPSTLSAVKAIVSRATSLYPDVPPLTTAELARLLSACPSRSAAAPRLILVDVRSVAERAVSTLPTALSPAQFQALPAAAVEGATVVPYCTVGLRSGAWGRQLLRAAAANGRDGGGGSSGGGDGDGSAPPPGLDVRNGEGVLLWVHAGGQLVGPREGSAAAGAAPPGLRTHRLHAFTGRYAALLPPGIEPEVFGWWEELTTTLSAGAWVVWQLLRGAVGTRS